MFVPFLYIFLMSFLYLFFYYAAGSIAMSFFPEKKTSFSSAVIVGFFSYYFLFTLLALPMKVTLQPLKLLSVLWGLTLILLTVVFLLLKRRQFRANIKKWQHFFNEKKYCVVIVLLALILTQAILYNLNDETYAAWDQSYYLGDTVTSLYTNTISQYDPYTGRILKHLNTEYLLETYQNHSSVMCQLFKVHPMVENLTVMATIVIILYNLIVFNIGSSLFHGSRKKGVIFTAFLALLNYFSFNLFTAAEFLMIRPSEGKTILAVIILPALLYFFLEIVKNPQEKTYWGCSFLTILGAFGLNMSSIYMIPFEISAFYLPLALRRKSPSVIVRYFILLLPCIAAALLYLLTKNHFIYTRR